MELVGIDIEVVRYLTLSLSPVIIIGIGVLTLKVLKNKRNKKNDEY